MLTILDEAISCIQTVLACANSLGAVHGSAHEAHESQLAARSQALIRNFCELQRLRAERAQSSSDKDGGALLLCLNKVQSSMTEMVTAPLAPESATMVMNSSKTANTHTSLASHKRNSVQGPKAPPEQEEADAAARTKRVDADFHEDQSELELDSDGSSSDEEVIRMNKSFATGTAPSQMGPGRQRRHMTDGRHVADGHPLNRLNESTFSGESDMGGSEPEDSLSDIPTEWYDFRALNNASPPTTSSDLPVKTSRRMPRIVPALALHSVRSNYSDESSTPRSIPSAPNSARLIISPRSAFDSVPSHRSSNTESDYGPISVRSLYSVEQN